MTDRYKDITVATKELRRMHDEGTCPEWGCPHCILIEQYDPPEPRGARDYLVTADYPEPQ